MEFEATDIVVTHRQAAPPPPPPPPFYYSVRIIKQVIKTKAAPYKALSIIKFFRIGRSMATLIDLT